MKIHSSRFVGITTDVDPYSYIPHKDQLRLDEGLSGRCLGLSLGGGCMAGEVLGCSFLQDSSGRVARP